MGITKERKEYLLNNLLLFMKQEIEDAGISKDNYWFVIKFEEEVYYMGVDKPRLESASEDTAKFISKYPCDKGELDIVIKYGIAHEYLKKHTYDSVMLTYSGFNKAEDYEEFLEQNITDYEIILNDYVSSSDDKINELIIKSRNLYLTKDLDGALEKIWDAFERLKTIFSEVDKKSSTKKLCASCSKNLDADTINNEFMALTSIGNNYQIRHFETNKKPIEDVNTKIYLYFRMLSLVIFAIKQVGES